MKGSGEIGRGGVYVSDVERRFETDIYIRIITCWAFNKISIICFMV